MSGVVIEVSPCKRGWFVVWLEKQDLRVCVGSAVVCDNLRNVGCAVVCHKLQHSQNFVVKLT